VGGDSAFAEDHPGVAATGEIDDCGGSRACGGAAVDDERKLVSKLVTNAARRGALGQAGEIGRGRGDGKAETLDDGARNGGFRHAEGQVAGVGRYAEGEFGTGFDDDGERAGPEAFGEAVEGRVNLAGELVRLGGLGDQKREGLVAGAGFELVDAIDGAEIDGVDGKAIEGVRGQCDNIAVVEAGGDVADERWLWLVGMDTESFCRQNSGSWGGLVAAYGLCGDVLPQSRTLAHRARWLNGGIGYSRSHLSAGAAP